MLQSLGIRWCLCWWECRARIACQGRRRGARIDFSAVVLHGMLAFLLFAGALKLN